MKVVVSEQLRKLLERALERDKWPDIPVEMEIPDAEFKRHYDELKGSRSEQERADKAIYRTLTFDKPIPSKGPTLETLHFEVMAVGKQVADMRTQVSAGQAHVDARLASIPASDPQVSPKIEEHLAEIRQMYAAHNAKITDSNEGFRTSIAWFQQNMVTRDDFGRAIGKIIFVALVLFAAFFLLAITARAQNTNPAIVVATCGTAPANYPAAGSRAPNTVDVNGNQCAGVSVSATVSTQGLAVALGSTTSGTQSGYAAAVFNTTAAPSYTNGTFNALSGDLAGNLRVNASVTVPGTLLVTTPSNAGSGAVAIVGSASDGTTATASPVRTGGVDIAGNVQDIRTTVNGETVVALMGTAGNIGIVTVTDGAGALNTIVDSGTITAVTTITNPVTVTDGAGSLNTIVDSGTLTAVTTITNPVTVTDGAGALNVIVDSGAITATVGNTVNVNFLTSSVSVVCTSGCSASSGTDIVSVRGTSIPGVGSGALAVVGITSSGVTAIGGPVIVGALSGTASQSLAVNTSSGGLKVDIASINAPATGPQTGANSDSVVCATDTRCIIATPTMVSGVPTFTLVNTSGTTGIVGGVNVAQYNGVAPVIVSGVPVVTLASTAGTIGALNANQSVNTAQINGVTPLMGNGVTGTGSQRVTIASDNTAFSVNVGTFPDNEPFNNAQWGGTTVVAAVTAGVAVTAPAIVVTNTPAYTLGQSVQVSANTAGQQIVTQADCGDHGQVVTVAISTAGIGNTQLVALTAGQTIYICGIVVMAGGTTNVTLSYGTGVQCQTGNVDLTGAMPLIAQVGWVEPNTGAMQYKAASGNAFCIENTAAVQVSGSLKYIKRP